MKNIVLYTLLVLYYLLLLIAIHVIIGGNSTGISLYTTRIFCFAICVFSMIDTALFKTLLSKRKVIVILYILLSFYLSIYVAILIAETKFIPLTSTLIVSSFFTLINTMKITSIHHLQLPLLLFCVFILIKIIPSIIALILWGRRRERKGD